MIIYNHIFLHKVALYPSCPFTKEKWFHCIPEQSIVSDILLINSVLILFYILKKHKHFFVDCKKSGDRIFFSGDQFFRNLFLSLARSTTVF